MTITNVFTGAIPKSQSLANFYFYRVVNIWNSLPVDMRSLELSGSDKNTSFEREVRKYYNERLTERFGCDNTYSWVTKCRFCKCRI